MPVIFSDPDISRFLAGKSGHTLALYNHFLEEFARLGDISVHAAKTMIGISNGQKRIAWIIRLGKDFLHVTIPFNKPYHDNLCFQKIAQVPGTEQYNHHLRLLSPEDVNDEVISYLKLALGAG